MSHCPICQRETDAKYKPFCSKRCADVDLARWMTGSYVIPTQNEEEEDSLPPTSPPPRPV